MGKTVDLLRGDKHLTKSLEQTVVRTMAVLFTGRKAEEGHFM